ncbi:MAG TPA: YbaB/EbfC family nucleoid-associated protein [Rectinemataceae bacterium]|nr:YbaB/EbfC family nucleoid-associated protein [Rectinemataceae bacterium]
MNIADLMEAFRNPQAIAAKAEEFKRKTEAMEATGSSGGGMVRVTIDGTMAVKTCVIAPEVVDPADLTMLQDLVVAAFNDAQARIREMLQAELTSGMGGLGGLGIPPGLFGGQA